MPHIRFSGRVLPAAAGLSIPNIPSVSWDSDDRSQHVDLNTIIKNGQITVDCTLNRFDNSELNFIYGRVYDVAHTVVDLYGFVTASGFIIAFDTYTNPDGLTTPVVISDSRLLPFITAGNASGTSFDELLKIAIPNQTLHRVLRDLGQAIYEPLTNAVSSARALEGIRNTIAPGSDPKLGWECLRTTLQIERSYLQLITDSSIPGRHGDISLWVPPETTAEIGRRAWIITDRCLQFLKRGGKEPLPLDQFPVLR